MGSLRKRLEHSPILVRVAPFFIFLGLTFAPGLFGEGSRYWFYLTKTIVGAGVIWVVWPYIRELKWNFTWEAALTGIVVFVIWVGLDDWYPGIGGEGAPWNPHIEFGAGTTLAWFFIVVRIAGSTVVVPPIEEVFYRSFLYRYIAKPDFQSVSFGYFHWLPFVATAAIFGFSHREWLAGILCGFAYQGLVIWKRRLGDAIVAHAITNLLLGLWVTGRGEWHFW